MVELVRKMKFAVLIWFNISNVKFKSFFWHALLLHNYNLAIEKLAVSMYDYKEFSCMRMNIFLSSSYSQLWQNKRNIEIIYFNLIGHF